MLRLKNLRDRQGFFTYTDPDTGFKSSRRSLAAVCSDAAKHRKSKNLPIPLNFCGIIEHNYCVDHPQLCFDENAPKLPVTPRSAPITNYPPLKQQVKGLISTVSQWIKAGGRTSTFEEGKRRLDICIGCEFWNGARDLFSFRCKKCGCCLRIKVTMATAHCPIGRW